jgi:hypothetical protein
LGADDLAAGLSTRMGELLLTDKEATGLVISGIGSAQVPRPRWAAVGMVCSPRRLVIGALERSMEKAWGLHRPAQFRDIGENRFVVRFATEGDGKHVMRNGPWKFDFNVVLLKDYDGSVRPSDMVFDSMEIWVRVLDLPMDMMNRVYGELIGNWIGRFVSVEVDSEGMAWGKDLKIRVAIRVDQPLVRGVPLKESEDEVEGKWFDIKYEKIPHFCFDCGCLVHAVEGCQAGSKDVKQWGEWLRASPRKPSRAAPVSRPSVSSSSFSSRSAGGGARFDGGVSIRDLPPRRKLAFNQEESSSSRTGGVEHRCEEEFTSPGKDLGSRASEVDGGKAPMEILPRKTRQGTFVRKPRAQVGDRSGEHFLVPLGARTKKRGSKQVWLPVPVRVVGEGDSESAGKRQRTVLVFDRLEDPSADPARQGRREQ